MVNNEAKQESSPCNRDIYVCGKKSREEEEEENVDLVLARERGELGTLICLNLK